MTSTQSRPIRGPGARPREASLSHLTSVDFFLSYWTMGPVGHTFLSFGFDNASA